MQSTTSKSEKEKKKKRLSLTSHAGMTIKQLVNPNNSPENSSQTSINNSSIAIEGTKHLMNLIELLSSEVDNLKTSLVKEHEEKELIKEWVQELFTHHFREDNSNKTEVDTKIPEDKKKRVPINFDEWLQDHKEQQERANTTKNLKRPPVPLRISNSKSLTSSSTYGVLTASLPNIPNTPYVSQKIIPPPPSSLDRSSGKLDPSILSSIPLPPPIVSFEIDSQNVDNISPKNEVGDRLVHSSTPGYIVEDGSSENSQNNIADSYELIESELEVPYYAKFFYNKPHSIFMWEDEKGEVLFLTIPAVSEQKDDAKVSAIITTFNGNKLVILKGTKNIKKRALQAVDLNPSLIQLREIKDLAIRNQLLSMEAREIQIRKRYKFGVLYAKENQTENEMFGNEHGSPEFDRFLDLLGERIMLNNWTKYTGGLDNKTGTTGTHSVYTSHRGVEIMFHVSTLLPFGESDNQQLERKRHLGNDVLVIVFKEGNTPFSPVFRSQFNCIFIVVQAITGPDNSTCYKVGITYKEGIAPFPPLLPDPPIFKNKELFRDFLLTKCINGERSAMHSPEFGPRLARARIGAMQLIAKEFRK